MKLTVLKKALNIFKRTLDPTKLVLNNVEFKNGIMTYTNGHYLINLKNGLRPKPGLYDVTALKKNVDDAAKQKSGDVEACFEGVKEFDLNGDTGFPYPNWEQLIPDYSTQGAEALTLTVNAQYLIDICELAKSISPNKTLTLTIPIPSPDIKGQRRVTETCTFYASDNNLSDEANIDLSGILAPINPGKRR